jgi:MraZ protein
MDLFRLHGDYEHTLDEKGRLTLPARYRKYFEEGTVLAKLPDSDPCVLVFHPDAWAEYESRHIAPLNDFTNRKDRWKTRIIFKNMSQLVPDRQGRVLIPAHFIKELGLSGKVRIIGHGNFLEIWNPATFLECLEEWEAEDDGEEAEEGRA